MTSSYSPVLTTKAVKDETEQRILRDAHVCHQHTDKHTAMYMHTHVHILLKKILMLLFMKLNFAT